MFCNVFEKLLHSEGNGKRKKKQQFTSIGNVAYLPYFSWYSHIFSSKFNKKHKNTSRSNESFPHDSQMFSPVSAFTMSKAKCRPGGMLRLSKESTVVCVILFQNCLLFSL